MTRHSAMSRRPSLSITCALSPIVSQLVTTLLPLLGSVPEREPDASPSSYLQPRAGGVDLGPNHLVCHQRTTWGRCPNPGTRRRFMDQGPGRMAGAGTRGCDTPRDGMREGAAWMGWQAMPWGGRVDASVAGGREREGFTSPSGPLRWVRCNHLLCTVHHQSPLISVSINAADAQAQAHAHAHAYHSSERLGLLSLPSESARQCHSLTLNATRVVDHTLCPP